jgi:uncharacterized protein YacL
MYFQDISKGTRVSDYLPILTAAILTDAIVMVRLLSGQFQSKQLETWYHKYGVGGVGADVLSITIGIIIARFLYPFLFNSFSVFKLAGLAVAVQLIHDLLFYQLFKNIPRGKSGILDVFKDYAKEMGAQILLADSAMMISTVFLASLFAGFSQNENVILLIISIYIILYLLYSI